MAILTKSPESPVLALERDSACLVAFDTLLKAARGVANIFADQEVQAHEFAQNAHSKS